MTRKFTVTCLDEERAQAFVRVLSGMGVDTEEVPTARNFVAVPWGGGSPTFVMDVYTLAVEDGYADDEVAARDMSRTLATLPGAR